MKSALPLSLIFIAIAVLTVLVFGPEEGLLSRWKTTDTDVRTEESVSLQGNQAQAGLRTPDSETPAAGVCDTDTNTIVTVAVTEDIPSPRCVRVSSGQKIRIENRTMERIEVSFMGTTNPIASAVRALIPGDAVLIDVPVEIYLSKGVHHFDASGYGSAEIWFDARNQ